MENWKRHVAPGQGAADYYRAHIEVYAVEASVGAHKSIDLDSLSDRGRPSTHRRQRSAQGRGCERIDTEKDLHLAYF